jgi:hypothetical protein
MTQRTANSAGSPLVFVRISCFGDNPVKYTDPDGKWFLIDDLFIAFYLKWKNNLEDKITKLMWASFFHSWQHPIEQGKLWKAFYDDITHIIIKTNNPDFEIEIITDVDDRTLSINVRKRVKRAKILSDEELEEKINKDVNMVIEKHKGKIENEN